METIEYLKAGRYDFFEKIRIDADGRYLVESGGYRSERPRNGLLSDERRQTLHLLVERLPETFNNVRDSRAFATRLVINTGQGAREFWIHPAASHPEEIGELVTFLREI